MDIEKSWNKALRNTEIVRPRVQGLKTHEDTQVPYILLSESTVNVGDTVVRKGEVQVNRPSLFIPPDNPMFHGFGFEKDNATEENFFVNFLLVRGVRLPSFHYDNQTQSLDVLEGNLSNAIKHYREELQKEENISTGLIVASEDCWPFSLLIFVCSQVARNADVDLRKLMNDYKNNQNKN
jgi:hypothetical protein